MRKTSCTLICFVVAFVLSLFIGTSHQAYGQENMAANSELKEFAQTALNNYTQNFLTEKNVAKFGFRTLGEAQEARVGEPLAMHIITLKDLKTYGAGAGLESIPVDLKATWLPVLVDDQVRAQLKVFHQEGRMIPGDFGSTTQARRLSSALDQVPGLLREKGISRAEQTSIVKIYALHALFLHLETEKGDYLLPAMAMPQRYELRNGVLYPAGAVLNRLRDVAKDLPDDLIG